MLKRQQHGNDFSAIALFPQKLLHVITCILMSQLLHNLCPAKTFILKIIPWRRNWVWKLLPGFFSLLLVDLSLDLSRVFQVAVISKDGVTGTQAGET